MEFIEARIWIVPGSLFTRDAPDRVKLDINDVIQEVIVLVCTEVVRNSVQLRLNLAAGLPHVLGNLVLLQQVLINLIMNAIDSMRTVTDRLAEPRHRIS
jgi:C4-dicarboxylate-specific signal transduction histidine kinase